MSSNLDPRSKLVSSVAGAIVLIVLGRWSILGLALVFLIALILLLRLGRAWLGLLKGLGFATVTFFLIGWVAFDLSTALVAGLRLLGVGMIFFLFFQTTPPEDLSNALIKIGLPYGFTFVLSASMQFVHVLSRRAALVRDAQRARGIPLDGGIKAILHLPALFGPLLIQAFKLADELAEAMEARGFGAPHRRFRHEPRFRKVDWMILALSFAILGIVLTLDLA